MEPQLKTSIAYPASRISPAWPVGLVLSARIVLSGLGIVLLIAHKVPLSEEGAIRPYFGIAPVTEGLSGALLGVWQRFDAIHYLRIASSGYSSTDLSAYFPLYPFLVRAFGTLLGRNYLLASLMISNIAAIFAVLLFYMLVIDEFDDQELAKRSITYLVFFPTGFFLLAPYTESIALLVCILAFREAKHGRWLTAGIAGFACSLARAQGVLICLILAAEAVRQYRQGKHPSPFFIFALFLPPVGLLSFMAWRYFAGFPPISSVLFTYWQRVSSVPFASVLITLQRMIENTAESIEYLDLTVVALMVILGFLVVFRLPLPYTIYYWTTLLFNLSQVRIPQPISSQARYALLLFPAFIVLGQLGAIPRNHRLILYSFLLCGSTWLVSSSCGVGWVRLPLPDAYFLS